MKFGKTIMPAQQVLANPKNNRLSSMSLKYFFYLILVVFGLDFGFCKFDSTTKNILMKGYCVFLALLYIITVNFEFFSISASIALPASEIWIFFDELMYFVFVVVLVSTKYTFYDFLTDVQKFDENIDVNNNHYFSVNCKIIIIFFLIFIYRIFVTVMCCLFTGYCIMSYHFRIFDNLSLVAMYFVVTISFIVYYVAYERIKKLIAFVDSTNVALAQRIYKNLADIIEKVKTPFDILFILFLIFNTVDITVTIYFDFIEDNIKLGGIAKALSLNTQLAQEVMAMVAPSLAAGLLAARADALKLKLHHLLLDADVKQSAELKRFLWYLSARGLRLRLCRVVPLDGRLPLLLLNLAVTYLIVMLQFSHKF